MAERVAPIQDRPVTETLPRRLDEAFEAARRALAGTGDWTAPAAWRRLTAAAGMAGLDLPPRVGGSGLSGREMAGWFARAAGVNLELRDVPGGGHARFLLGANTRRFDPVLRRVAAGEEIVAIAITEAAAGSDLHGVESMAVPDGDGYLLSGRKQFVARLEEATWAVVFAHVARPDAERTLTSFLVPLAQPGITRTRLDPAGLEGVSFGACEFDNVRLTRDMRVGGEGQALSLFVQHFAYWRAATAASAIGCARAAIDQAAAWLADRHAFGGPIGRFTHLQQELATHVSRLHMAWLLVLDTMDRLDRHQAAFADAAMAKAEAVEAAVAAVDWCMRVHGARGHTSLLDLERRFRGLLCLRIADGTTDVLRGQIARAVLGGDLYELSLGRRATAREGRWTRRFW